MFIKNKERAWAEINLDNVAYNYRTMIETLRPGCKLIAVIKADGYGHGAVMIAKFLEQLGCRTMAVSSYDEAMELRDSGITATVMLLSPISLKYIHSAMLNNFIIPLVSTEQAKKISDYAHEKCITVSAYIMIDCGLSRFGIVVYGREQEAAREVKEISALPKVYIHSLMTHLTAGGIPEKHELNIIQLTRFKDFSNSLEMQGVNLAKHCCASRFAVRYPDYNFDYARIGSGIFGVHPYYGTGPHFRPAMQLKARIIQLKEVGAGTTVGYGPVFTAERNTKIAVLPIGYADGLSCHLGNKMNMLIHGKFVSQIGRLGMDYCMVDVTDAPNVHEGDVVTLFGEDNGSFVSVQEHAAIYSGTASELICLLGRRIPRFYYKDGKEYM